MTFYTLVQMHKFAQTVTPNYSLTQSQKVNQHMFAVLMTLTKLPVHG